MSQLCFIPSASAQLIYEDSTALVNISSLLGLLEDENSELSSAKVFQEPATTFEYATDEVLNFKHTSSRFWMRLEIQNPSNKELYLYIQNPQIQILNVYLKDSNGQIKSIKSGASTLYETRHLRSSDFSFSLGRDPYLLYIETATNTDFIFPAFVGSAVAVISKTHYLDLFNGAFLGIMFSMLLYNLFIFFMIKERIYFYYFLHIMMSLIMMMRFRGIGFDLIWSNYPWLNAGSSTFLCLIVITSILFSTNFLDMKRYAPLLNRYFWFLAILSGLLFCLIPFNIQPFTNIAIQIVAGVLSISLLFTGIYIHWLGNKVARFYILAWSVLLISNIILILTLNGMFPVNFYTLGAFQIGSAIEAILLSNALAHRINIYKHERETAQEAIIKEVQKNEQLVLEQNVLLEEKITIRTADLMEEKEKTDQLLRNILPASIVDELKLNGKAAPKLHPQVSVMFIDIVAFTKVSEEISPQKLVADIDRLFTGFDKIMRQYQVEKIKTIGDAYLAVSGLNQPESNHSFRIVQAAIAAIDFVKKTQAVSDFFDVRIGIHCGPVVAGVVGEDKFAYDIWGDTVNIAARLEQNSDPGRINVSADIYERLQDTMGFEYRGKIEVKNKGAIDMHFII